MNEQTNVTYDPGEPGKSTSINKKIMSRLITLLYHKYDERTTFPAQRIAISVLEILANQGIDIHLLVA